VQLRSPAVPPAQFEGRAPATRRFGGDRSGG
jgi:hypothetical protein